MPGRPLPAGLSAAVAFGFVSDLSEHRALIEAGGPQKYHEANAAKGKLFARERVAAARRRGLVRRGRAARQRAGRRPAGRRRGDRDGARSTAGPVCLMANDSTVKAGSWGARTVEKIVRIIERAYRPGVPMVYLVDSAGARITDQVELFPGRRGAGRIFWNQVRASGSIPQVCALFGPSAAGGAYIPAFCDVVVMVEGNASMYLGSDRMVEMVTGEKTTLEEMGGARCTARSPASGTSCAPDEPTRDRDGAPLPVLPAVELDSSRRRSAEPVPPAGRRRPARARPGQRPAGVRHAALRRGAARRGLALRDPRAVGAGAGRRLRPARTARPSAWSPTTRCSRAACCSSTRADKAARFIQLCDAFNVPLLFLADVPGFMVGAAVERQGIIRHGAKMITAVSRGDRAEDLRRRAQGVRRRAVRDGRARLRAGRDARAADRDDRGDGRGGGRQRGLRQQDRGDRGRGRAGRVRAGRSGTSTTRTSTSCTWPASWWWTRSCEPEDLRDELVRRFARRTGQGPVVLAAAGTASRRSRARACQRSDGVWRSSR